MNRREQGVLLLTSQLGDPDRRPLTVAQFRALAKRAAAMPPPDRDRQLTVADLKALGYGDADALRILSLLDQQTLLERYAGAGRQRDCYPVTRVSSNYPPWLRRRLGLDAPGSLWAKGDLSLLGQPCISLVGSRELYAPNAAFAAEAGRQAARQGFVLISGNARGADKIAQASCLEHGGRVICVVADLLEKHPLRRRVLYLSEDGFDLDFTAVRALSRNRVIHALGSCTLVAQCSLGTGGTWSGTQKNLRQHWSPVFCFDDGSAACQALVQMGASAIKPEALAHIAGLKNRESTFFDE